MNPLYSKPELRDLKPSSERYSKLSYVIDKSLGIKAKDSHETSRKQLEKMFKIETNVPIFSQYIDKKKV